MICFRSAYLNGPNRTQTNGPNRAQQMNGPNRAWSQQGPTHEFLRMGPTGPGAQQSPTNEWSQGPVNPREHVKGYYRSEGFALTGYVVPGCVEDGAGMLWTNSSATAVVVVVSLA